MARFARTSDGLLPLFLLCGAAGAAAQTVDVADSVDTADSAGLPLQPTRTHRFTTDEGTWMSLDVSPDGTTIVFDLLGDLYTLPITGGDATRITHGMAFDAQPRFSPDGRQIVFVSDRSGEVQLWLGSADGTELRQFSTEPRSYYASPVWDPDGKGIIAVKGHRGQLVYQAMSGGSGVQIRASGDTAGTFRDPSIGADSRYIYATTTGQESPLDNVLATHYRWQLAVVDRASGKRRVLTSHWGGALRPAVSPDGRWVVYGTRLDTATVLRLYEPATGDDRPLGVTVDRDVQEYPHLLGLLPGGAFTPDSRALILAAGGKFQRIEIPSGRTSVIPFTADVELALAERLTAEHAIEDSSVPIPDVQGARVSPDGSRLAFSAVGRLWYAELAEGPPARLTSADVGEHSPVWSPDGRHIAYVTWHDTIGGHIYRVLADGSQPPERLTTTAAFYDQLAYTPDGTHLVAVRGSKHLRTTARPELKRPTIDGYDLVSIPADGGEATLLMPLEVDNAWVSFDPVVTHPHFGLASDRVMLNHPTDGLVSVRLDGSDRQALLKSTGSGAWGSMSQKIVMSPTEEHAVILHGEMLFVADMPGFARGLAIDLKQLAGAPVRVRKITEVGGKDPSWSPDGKTLYYSYGHSFFSYDVTGADSIAAHRHEIELSLPRRRPDGAIALRNARVITMRGAEVLERGDVVISRNRITAVGPSGSVDIPSDAEVIDLDGKTILPGWVDVHAHMQPARGVHRTQPWEYLAQLAYGVTTTRDPQSFTFDVRTYAAMVDAGMMIGPRVLTTGRGVFGTNEFQSREQIRDYLRRYSEHYRVGTLKIYAIGDRKIRQWAIAEAHAQGLVTTTEGMGDLRMNLTAAMDGYDGLEHNLTALPVYKDVIELFASSGITYTPTLLASYAGPAGKKYFFQHHDVRDDAKLSRFVPRAELDRLTLRDSEWSRADQYVFPKIAAQAAKIAAAGGSVGIGGHGELQGLGTVWELVALSSGGMPLHDVLRAGTAAGAQAIGLGGEIGSIEAGKLADIQVLDENPLEDIWNALSIRYVMTNGLLYDAKTLDEVWPNQRALPRQWWW